MKKNPQKITFVCFIYFLTANRRRFVDTSSRFLLRQRHLYLIITITVFNSISEKKLLQHHTQPYFFRKWLRKSKVQSETNCRSHKLRASFSHPDFYFLFFCCSRLWSASVHKTLSRESCSRKQNGLSVAGLQSRRFKITANTKQTNKTNFGGQNKSGPCVSCAFFYVRKNNEKKLKKKKNRFKRQRYLANSLHPCGTWDR